MSSALVSRSLRVGPMLWAPDERGLIDQQIFPLLSTGVPAPPEVTVPIATTPGHIGGIVPDVRGWGAGSWAVDFAVTDRTADGQHGGSVQLERNRGRLFELVVTTRGTTRLEIDEGYDPRRPEAARCVRVADAVYAGMQRTDADYESEVWRVSWLIPAGVWMSRDHAEQAFARSVQGMRLRLEWLDAIPGAASAPAADVLIAATFEGEVGTAPLSDAPSGASMSIVCPQGTATIVDPAAQRAWSTPWSGVDLAGVFDAPRTPANGLISFDTEGPWQITPAPRTDPLFGGRHTLIIAAGGAHIAVRARKGFAA